MLSVLGALLWDWQPGIQQVQCRQPQTGGPFLLVGRRSDFLPTGARLGLQLPDRRAKSQNWNSLSTQIPNYNEHTQLFWNTAARLASTVSYMPWQTPHFFARGFQVSLKISSWIHPQETWAVLAILVDCTHARNEPGVYIINKGKILPLSVLSCFLRGCLPLSEKHWRSVFFWVWYLGKSQPQFPQQLNWYNTVFPLQ